MNKEKAAQELKEAQIMLAEAQARIAKAEEELSKPKRKSLLEKPEWKHWSIDVHGSTCKFSSDPYNGLTFKEREDAENYYKAFKTMIALRQCEGSVHPEYGKQLHYLLPSVSGLEFREVLYLEDVSGGISPLFESEESLLNAVNTVGRENIIHMFKTLGHF